MSVSGCVVRQLSWPLTHCASDPPIIITIWRRSWQDTRRHSRLVSYVERQQVLGDLRSRLFDGGYRGPQMLAQRSCRATGWAQRTCLHRRDQLAVRPRLGWMLERRPSTPKSLVAPLQITAGMAFVNVENQASLLIAASKWARRQGDTAIFEAARHGLWRASDHYHALKSRGGEASKGRVPECQD